MEGIPYSWSLGDAKDMQKETQSGAPSGKEHLAFLFLVCGKWEYLSIDLFAKDGLQQWDLDQLG